MDSTIDDFVRKVLDFRHTQLPRTELLRVATHLRDVVQPQLVEREALLAENAKLKADLEKAKKGKAAA